ncbi:hypothetical protein CF140_16450 [Aeromonas sobria]|nr:hypothetical protein CF140_16450 [Aeromonas sobria]
MRLRFSQLAIGYWLLAIGYWLLAIGYWLLAIGYWLLAISLTAREAVLAVSIFGHSYPSLSLQIGFIA